ncbi:MAG: D-aminoacylase [Candidatus Moranbacteria bacterium]|nr:D-aminoacylase [Candidatus Moranbacteria bacterium]MDD3965133.1 D-aminoacylase [Candidatus Moranbacteria bacterium]
MYDIVIKNGTIIDGSGRPMFRADIAIKEGIIASIGDLASAQAERIIDADGQYVAPGFVDVNNHSDTYWQIFNEPGMESLVSQGVTTIIGGNSGASLAPLFSPENIRAIQKWTNVEKINFNWLSMQDFLKETERRRIGVNFATLVGHGTLRRGAMDDKTRTITPDEIHAMDAMLEKALEEGAIGLSTGLAYTHARGARTRELSTLAKTAVSHQGIYATYVRDEGADVVKAVEEAILVAREAESSLHISHLKVVGKKNWHYMDDVFHLIETAALDEVPISFDVYPYTTTGSVLYTLLPEWITGEGRKMMLARLKDAGVRSTVLRDMKQNDTDYSQITISSSHLNKMLSRRKISEIALLQGKTPEETVLDFLIASEGQAIVSFEALSEKNVLKSIQHPFSIISSNGVGYSTEYAKSGNLVHPRNFGTFPKVFAEYVRNQKALSWEEAVHKMTGKPAKQFQLEKRGLLQEGYFADIVIFQPDNIADRATIEEPYQYSTGISFVIINGQFALANDTLIPDARYGMVLRKKNKHWFGW